MIEDTTEEDVEEALRRQDEALALLEQLRVRESASTQTGENSGGGRRDFRRWPAPKEITAEMHDGSRWQPAECSDFGIGGARLSAVPTWLNGPVPVRLKGTTGTAVLALGDLMWRDAANDAAGLRLEFQDTEERDLWTATLIDALLARYALV
jgi:hypothetical protein